MDKFAIEVIETIDDILESHAALESDNPTTADLMRLDHHMTCLFAKINSDGVCRSDIEQLNRLGFNEIESKYFSVERSTIGLESVQAFEIKAGFVGTIVSATMLAVVAAIAYVGFKLYKLIRKAQASISEVFKARSKLSSLIGDTRMEVKSITFPEKTSGASTTLCSILAMPDGGRGLESIARKLVDNASTLADVLHDLSNEDSLGGKINKLIDGKSVTSAKDIHEIISHIPPSPLASDSASIKYLVDMIGSHLKDARSDNVSDFKALVEYRGSKIFDDKYLSSGATRKFDLDTNTFDTTSVESNLEKVRETIPNLEKYQARLVKGSSSEELRRRGFKDVDISTRNADSIIKAYINSQVIDSANYIKLLSTKVIPAYSTSLILARLIQESVLYDIHRLFSPGMVGTMTNFIKNSGLSSDKIKSLTADWEKSSSADASSAITGLKKLLDTLTTDNNVSSDIRSKILTSSLSKLAAKLSERDGFVVRDGIKVTVL